MIDIPDDPIIARTERTGYGYDVEPVPVCPICGFETDTFYVDKYGNVCGCPECMSTEDAYEFIKED